MHNWIIDHDKTISEEKIRGICALLNEKIVILEHWHYCGARAPDRIIFDDPEELKEYLNNNTIAGDSLWFWNFTDLCNENSSLINGKIPNNNGEIPEGGAY